MRLIRTFVVFAFTFTAYYSSAQKLTNSIGLRLGEPLGLSYKKHFNNNRAFEITLGTADSRWSASYYENSFHREFDRDDFRYLRHKAKNIIYVQGRYLFENHITAEGIKGNLEWYWGLGILFKAAEVQYHYQIKNFSSENFQYTKDDIDLGPEAIAGVQYTFENIPLTIFVEISALVEIVNRPAFFRGFSAIGLRYNF